MFEERPASKRSLTKRELVRGVGVNDAPYVIRYKENGKYMRCPYYQQWDNMLSRAYNVNYHRTRPSYVGCSVDPRWHKFTDFRKWMEKQDWEGKCLDKDILVQGNKCYSPDTCIFVSNNINVLMSDAGRTRKNGLPKGVNKNGKRYKAEMYRGDASSKHIGTYDTPEEAHTMYTIKKCEVIKEVAAEQEPRLRDALIRHAKALEDTLVDRTEQEDTEQERLGV